MKKFFICVLLAASVFVLTAKTYVPILAFTVTEYTDLTSNIAG